MFKSRAGVVLACTAVVLMAACGGSSSTTAPSPAAADASTSEPFVTTVTPGGGVFYSFDIATYGNVAVTVTSVTGSALPDDFTIGIGIGRPAGTSCTTSTSVSAAPGDTPQLTGTFGPGVFCVRIYDTGTLTDPVRVTASVAHS